MVTAARLAGPPARFERQPLAGVRAGHAGHPVYVRHSAFSAELRGRAKQALADAERAREEARQSGAGLFRMWTLRRQTDQLRRELDGPADGPADGPVDGQQAERLARKVNQLKQTTRSTISAARQASQRRKIRR
jgi:hypothetical protein